MNQMVWNKEPVPGTVAWFGHVFILVFCFSILLFSPFPPVESFFCRWVEKQNSFSPWSENQYKNLEYLLLCYFPLGRDFFWTTVSRRYNSFCLFIAHKIYNDLWNVLNFANISLFRICHLFLNVCLVGSSSWHLTA